MSFIEINMGRTVLASIKYDSLPGQRFGDVRVIGFAESNNSNVKRVQVRCRCGSEYPMTAIYLRKIESTRCRRCSQILKNRGREGYELFLRKGEYKTITKGTDDTFRKLRREL